MKSRIFVISILGVALLAGCTRDKAVEPVIPDSPQSKYDQADLEVIRDLEKLDAEMELQLTKSAAGKVELADGSVDGLAAAIAATGPGGTVLVKTGEHRESGTVTITHPVTILGEASANLVFDTKPQPPKVIPALHLLNAPNVTIWGLKIRAKEDVGNTAILVENSPHAAIGRNTIIEYQYSVLLQNADHSRVYRNTITATPVWQTGELANVFGIVVINGDKVRIVRNDISNALFGVWPCDRDGSALDNTLHGNYIGMLLCTVLDGDFVYPSGDNSGTDASSTGWRVVGNQSTGNLDAGYLAIDGANNNFLKNNDASNNGTYDIELTGDSYRFGFLTPKSFSNTVIAGQFPNLKIKNCGENNTVVGGQLVDNAQDPCF